MIINDIKKRSPIERLTIAETLILSVIEDLSSANPTHPNASNVLNALDCISRQAAIDALGNAGLINYQATGDGNGMIQAINVIKGLPSAEPKPDENTLSKQHDSDKLGVKTGKTCTDVISRDAAKEAIRAKFKSLPSRWEINEVLNSLPSAEPEITDEQVKDYCRKRDLAVINIPERLCIEFYPRSGTNTQGVSQNLVWAILVQNSGMVSNVPAAEPEIIRCKDCKYRYVDGDNVRFNLCELNHNMAHSDDWYCADAERREDEQTD